MDIATQNAIVEEGAAAMRSHRPDLNGEKWRLNHYKEDTDEYFLWMCGYEAEAERLGSVGQNI